MSPNTYPTEARDINPLPPALDIRCNSDPENLGLAKSPEACKHHANLPVENWLLLCAHQNTWDPTPSLVRRPHLHSATEPALIPPYATRMDEGHRRPNKSSGAAVDANLKWVAPRASPNSAWRFRAISGRKGPRVFSNLAIQFTSPSTCTAIRRGDSYALARHAKK